LLLAETESAVDQLIRRVTSGAAERQQRHVLPVRQEEETGGPSYHSRLAISNYPLERKFFDLVGVFAKTFIQNSRQIDMVKIKAH
jgi:hypothetical protein